MAAAAAHPPEPSRDSTRLVRDLGAVATFASDRSPARRRLEAEVGSELAAILLRALRADRGGRMLQLFAASG